ncbi:hypothetical protein L3V86_02060 [Thiotrichales bacterium 19S11-10]|nr:hypothetical protein [Thiotrichales bacterium 19S11-10]
MKEKLKKQADMPTVDPDTQPSIDPYYHALFTLANQKGFNEFKRYNDRPNMVYASYENNNYRNSAFQNSKNDTLFGYEKSSKKREIKLDNTQWENALSTFEKIHNDSIFAISMEEKFLGFKKNPGNKEGFYAEISDQETCQHWLDKLKYIAPGCTIIGNQLHFKSPYWGKAFSNYYINAYSETLDKYTADSRLTIFARKRNYEAFLNVLQNITQEERYEALSSARGYFAQTPLHHFCNEDDPLKSPDLERAIDTLKEISKLLTAEQFKEVMNERPHGYEDELPDSKIYIISKMHEMYGRENNIDFFKVLTPSEPIKPCYQQDNIDYNKILKQIANVNNGFKDFTRLPPPRSEGFYAIFDTPLSRNSSYSNYLMINDSEVPNSRKASDQRKIHFKGPQWEEAYSIYQKETDNRVTINN